MTNAHPETTANNTKHDMHPDSRLDSPLARNNRLKTDLFHLRVAGQMDAATESILTPEALLFIEELEMKFGERRRQLLAARAERRKGINSGTESLDFLPAPAAVRSAEWRVASAPADLNERNVEITGPAEAKMMINALNSGASVFMADLEDAMSPTWTNAIAGQVALKAAVRRTLSFQSADGRDYRLADKTATLVVRPRGWHLVERNVRFDSEPVSGSLFDFGLYFFHNAHELMARGSGPYFYLPKMESHLEARLWNDVFCFAQERLGIPRGTIRATVLIETILAAFEMEEILYELKEHAAGLNAGRWDYLFSMIKTFSTSSPIIFPDRAQLTMTVPFMRAYTRRLVATCHKRGAHAIGGMAAFIPSRRDAEVNERAMAKVREDKEREAGDGFDGTWVAHPDLVPVAREVFAAHLKGKPHQKDVTATVGFTMMAKDLLPCEIENGRVTDEGVSNNISVALQYMSSWLQGLGAVAINNLMEDAATAEISRAELWQWVKREVPLAGGIRLTRDEFRRRLETERARFAGQAERGRLKDACDLLEKLVLADEFSEFLTLPAYEILEAK